MSRTLDRIRFAAILLIPALALAAASARADKTFDSPESVAIDPATGTLYVSNIGGNPGVKDANGFISRLKPDGTVETLKFLPAGADKPLNGPTGLVLAGTTLWVADVDRVVGYDVAKKKQVRVFDLAPFDVKFANDLLLDGDHRLLVSDTAGDQVIAIDTKTGHMELIVKGATGGANGLFIDPATGDLLIASSPGDFKTPALSWRLHTVAGKPFHELSPITRDKGIYDGIAVVGGQILISDWTRGAILRLAADGTSTTVVTGIKGPADFAVTPDGKRLVVPDMVAGTVTFYPITKE